MRGLFTRIITVSAVLMLTGCLAQVPYDYDATSEADLLARVIGPEPPQDLDILALTPEIKALIDAEINPRWSSRGKLKRLRKLLLGEDELNIHYESSYTLTASETFDNRSGNCLALTSLFVAAARYVGIEAYYRAIEVPPTWDHEGRTMIRYEHIVAAGQVSGGGEWVVDFLPEFIIGDQPTIVVRDEHARALYYSNRGAESLVDGDTEAAIGYLREALKIKPDHSDTWNNMGAAMRRSGQNELAEFSYLRSLKFDVTNESALSNLSQFYKATGRARDASQFENRVRQYRQRNPYFHYFLAQLMFRVGDYREARSYLEQSIRLKRDEPDFYTALAHAHEQLGDPNKSAAMLDLAEKYRDGTLRVPPRRDNHRFWNMVIDVNPN